MSYSLDVGYRLSRDSRIGIVATSWNRQSTELLRGYADFRVGMSFSYGLRKS